jgi:uncharacterized RDD family membrane protein YckC
MGNANGVSATGSEQNAAIRYASIVGGEAVPIDLRVARFGSRSIAFLIDQIVQWIALAFLLGFVGGIGLEPAAAAALDITFLVIVFIGYPTVMETAWGGRTLGKAAMGLRAARDDGGPLRFRHALIRSLTRIFGDGYIPSLGLIGAVTMLMSAQSKRLGDMFAGTVVLQARVPQVGGFVAGMPPPLAGWATTLDLSRFPDGLALQCRQFLGRAHQLSPEARERLGASLVTAVQAVVTPWPPPGTPGWAYISAVLAERRRREEWRIHQLHIPGPPPPLPQVQPHNLTKAPAETGNAALETPPAPPPSGGFSLPG